MTHYEKSILHEYQCIVSISINVLCTRAKRFINIFNSLTTRFQTACGDTEAWGVCTAGWASQQSAPAGARAPRGLRRWEGAQARVRGSACGRPVGPGPADHTPNHLVPHRSTP